MSRFLVIAILLAWQNWVWALNFDEVCRIKISNQANGPIEVSKNQGKAWKKIGSVISPATAVNDRGYTASKWVEDGVISATSVNAIHVKTGLNTFEGRGIIFSILPSGYQQLPSVAGSHLRTNIPAGKGIFGGGYAPFVGNKVFAIRGGKLYSAGATYIPQLEDVVVIRVEAPRRYPKEVIFENRFGGKVSIEYFDGEKRIIAEVLRPVFGVGRFEGTKFAAAGRVRANHAGVIDVSTSPPGAIGGFQIIPSGHAMSEEMSGARQLTQWMIVGSALEGVPPLFKYFIRPAYSPDDLEGKDWETKTLSRFLVEAKFKGGGQWRPMPIYEFDPYYLMGELPEWAGDALREVTHFRILFAI